MSRVFLTGNLGAVTGGETEFDLPARNVRELLRMLEARHPALGPHLEDGIAVAIDGEIFQDDWLAAIGPDSEVHLMPKIAGG